MPGRTKEKLQPFTCVLFSQFEALEFQSSQIKRLNSWHFKVVHSNKLLKPFKWLFKKCYMQPLPQFACFLDHLLLRFS